MGGEVDGGHVADSEVDVGACRPAAVFVEVGDSQLVAPHDAVLDGVGAVAYADEHDADVAQRGVAEHGGGVGSVVGIVRGPWDGEPDALLAGGLGLVAGRLDRGEELEGYVEVVVLWPDLVAVGAGAVVVEAGGGEVEGYLVLVVVVLDVGAEAEEERDVAVAEVCGVVDERLGVDPHLEALVDAEVHLGVLVHAACVAGLESGDFHLHGLLVELQGLRLPGVLGAVHAGGQDVVDGGAGGVLLDVDGGDVELALGRGIVAVVEVEVVASPLAAHELEGCEAQVRHGLEVGHEHAGKAYG